MPIDTARSPSPSSFCIEIRETSGAYQLVAYLKVFREPGVRDVNARTEWCKAGDASEWPTRAEATEVATAWSARHSDFMAHTVKVSE